MGHGASQPSTHAIIRPAAPQPSVAPSGLPGHGIVGHEGRSTRSSYDNLDEASDADDYGKSGAMFNLCSSQLFSICYCFKNCY